MKNVKNIIVGVIVIAFIVVAVLFATGNIKVKNGENQIENEITQEQNNETINEEKNTVVENTEKEETKINEDNYLGY